jgi:hypothetical protein
MHRCPGATLTLGFGKNAIGIDLVYVALVLRIAGRTGSLNGVIAAPLRVGSDPGSLRAQLG